MYIVKVAIKILGILLLAAFGILVGLLIKDRFFITWVQYTAVDHSFSAVFSSDPVAEEIETPSPFQGKSVSYSSYTYSPFRGMKAQYRIDAFEIPNGMEQAQEKLLALTIVRLGGKLVSGAPNGALKMSFEDGDAIYFKVVESGDRMYRLIVAHPQWNQNLDDISHFFSSFAAQ